MTLTKSQFKQKARQSYKENRKLFEKCLEKTVSCEAINFDDWDNDFMLSKAFMYALAKEMQNQWKPFSKKCFDEAEKLALFF